MTDSIQTSKAELRRAVRGRLTAMTAAQRERASAAIVEQLIALDVFTQAQTIMLYMPIATEVDVTGVAHWCLERNKAICVPKTDWARRDMDAVQVHDLGDDAMAIDERGIRTPSDGPVVPTGQIDLAVVPGLAFTLAGDRLGRGAGYYDRFLKRLRGSAVTIGPAFSEQIVEEIPLEEHDVPVDIVITDREVSFAESPSSSR